MKCVHFELLCIQDPFTPLSNHNSLAFMSP